MGAWGYCGSVTHSKTALIPVFFGIVLLIVTPQFKKGNKVIAHIVVILTFFLLIALIKPLTSVIGRNDTIALFRVTLMMFVSLIALIIFIKGFVGARLKKKD